MKFALVCGGREGNGQEVVFGALDVALQHAAIPRWEAMVVGSDRGTDWEAWRWSVKHEMPSMVYPARWRTSTYGAGAGPLRNKKMHEWANPVVVLGFPGGRGTGSMLSISCRAATPTWVWKEERKLWMRVDRA